MHYHQPLEGARSQKIRYCHVRKKVITSWLRLGGDASIVGWCEVHKWALLAAQCLRARAWVHGCKAYGRSI